MKKFIAGILALILLLSLCGCKKEEAKPSAVISQSAALESKPQDSKPQEPQKEFTPLNLTAEPFRKSFVSSGRNHTAYVLQDGSVTINGSKEAKAIQAEIDSWSNIVSVAAGNWFTLGLTEYGQVFAAGKDKYSELEIDGLENVGAIAAGAFHSVALINDGTVKAFGRNDNGECNTEGWSGIIQVAAGDHHTVALKEDGTVLSVGADNAGQCQTLDWKDIVCINANGSVTAGLKKDGTVLIAGSSTQAKKTADWSGIVLLDVGINHICALKEDGTFLSTAIGYYDEKKLDTITDVHFIAATPTGTDLFNASGNLMGASTVIAPEQWTDIQKLAAGRSHLVGLKNDGTVVAQGSNREMQLQVEGWTDIVDIVAGNNFTLGLRKDGSVVFTGEAEKDDLSDWTDITAIQGKVYYAVGLKKDGTVVDIGTTIEEKYDLGVLDNVKKVSTDGIYITVALLNDGTLKVFGKDHFNLKAAEGWKGITDFHYSEQGVLIGFGEDKTYFAGESEFLVPSLLEYTDRPFTDIPYGIATIDDGRVYERTRMGQTDTGWSNIKFICLGFEGLLGVREDGTVCHRNCFFPNEDFKTKVSNIRTE